MKLHLLFFCVALLSIGIMPVAVAQPRSVFNHTDLNQAEAAPPLLETSESSSGIDYRSKDSEQPSTLSDSETWLLLPIFDMSPFSAQKRTDTSAVA